MLYGNHDINFNVETTIFVWLLDQIIYDNFDFTFFAFQDK